MADLMTARARWIEEFMSCFQIAVLEHFLRGWWICRSCLSPVLELEIDEMVEWTCPKCGCGDLRK